MRTRKDQYRSIRGSIIELGALQGEKTTGDIIFGLDRLWRSMLHVRKVITETLVETGRIRSGADTKPLDFFNLYCLIHSPKTDHQIICNGCLSKIDSHLIKCPFCGQKLISPETGNNQMPSLEIFFERKNTAPNWDINYHADEMLEVLKEPTQFDEILQPITQRDDILGPRGHSKKIHPRKGDSLSSSTRKLLIWLRKREFGKVMPLSGGQLLKLSFPDLRAIATLMPNYDFNRISAMQREELTQYILANQGDAPRNPGPPPFGEMPDIEDLKA